MAAVWIEAIGLLAGVIGILLGFLRSSKYGSISDTRGSP